MDLINSFSFDLGANTSIATEILVDNSLVHLDLNENLIGNAGAISLSEYLKSKHNIIEYLDLTNCKITSKGGNAIFGALYF